MSKIEQWLQEMKIVGSVKRGEPEKSESPYKVMAKRKVPWSKTEEMVPVNDPAAQGYTIFMTKPYRIPSPDPTKENPPVPPKSTSGLTLPFFTAPGSNKHPTAEDVVKDLQEAYRKCQPEKYRIQVVQPRLGSLILLEGWLGREKFQELMAAD